MHEPASQGWMMVHSSYQHIEIGTLHHHPSLACSWNSVLGTRSWFFFLQSPLSSCVLSKSLLPYLCTLPLSLMWRHLHTNAIFPVPQLQCICGPSLPHFLPSLIHSLLLLFYFIPDLLHLNWRISWSKRVNSSMQNKKSRKHHWYAMTAQHCLHIMYVEWNKKCTYHTI